MCLGPKWMSESRLFLEFLIVCNQYLVKEKLEEKISLVTIVHFFYVCLEQNKISRSVSFVLT